MLAKYTTNETFTFKAVLNDMDPADGNQNGVVGYSWKEKKVVRILLYSLLSKGIHGQDQKQLERLFGVRKNGVIQN